MLRWKLVLVFLTAAHSKSSPATSSRRPVVTTTSPVPVPTQAPIPVPGYPFPFPAPGPLPGYAVPQPIIPIQPGYVRPNPFEDHYPVAPNGHGAWPVPPSGHQVPSARRVAYGQGFKRVTCRCCCREETITPRFRVSCQQPPAPLPQPNCDCSRIPCAPCGCVMPTGCGNTGTTGCGTPSYPIGPSDCSRRPFDPDCNRVPIQYGGPGVEIPPFLNPEGFPDSQTGYPSGSQYPLGPDPYGTTTIPTTTKSSSTLALTSALALIIAKRLFA